MGIDDLMRDYILRNPMATQEELQGIREALEREQMVAPPAPQPTNVVQPTSVVQPTVEQPAIQKPEVNVRDYLLKKYEDQFGPEAFKTARQQAETEAGSWQNKLGAFLQGAGQAYAGNAQAAGLAASSAMERARKQATEKYVAPLQEQKAAFMEKIALGEKLSDEERKKLGWTREDEQFARTEASRKREEDPNSIESQIARDLIKEARPSLNVEGMTALEIKQSYPQVEKLYEIRVRKEQADEMRKFREQEFGLKKEEAARKVEEKKAEPTEGEKVVDREFAKDYNDWTSQGRSGFEKNINKLKAARDIVAKGDVTTSGRLVGRLPDILRGEESLSVQQMVQGAAQGALRSTLGAQFTEKEGERIMAYAYDPKLENEENLKKIDEAIAELEAQAKAKESKAQFYEKNKTLRGWTGEPVMGGTDQAQPVRKKYNPATGRLE